MLFQFLADFVWLNVTIISKQKVVKPKALKRLNLSGLCIAFKIGFCDKIGQAQKVSFKFSNCVC